tara:strand:- start:2813 stop:3643 length:831 start_codon:yes stop_codon:yes gene_type:complete
VKRLGVLVLALLVVGCNLPTIYVPPEFQREKGSSSLGYHEEIWSNGARYTGFHTFNVSDGIGTFIFGTDQRLPAGTIQKGWWDHGYFKGPIKTFSKNDYKEGVGKVVFADNSSYIGEWKNDKPHGLGFIFWENKMYAGNFKSGLPRGFGRFTDDKYPGYIFKGRFESNNFDTKVTGYGYIITPDGKEIQGSFNKGKFFPRQRNQTLENFMIFTLEAVITGIVQGAVIAAINEPCTPTTTIKTKTKTTPSLIPNFTMSQSSTTIRTTQCPPIINPFK